MKKLIVLTLVLSLFSSLSFAHHHSGAEQAAQQEIANTVNGIDGNHDLLSTPNSELTTEELKEKYEMVSELIDVTQDKIARFKTGRNAVGAVTAFLGITGLVGILAGVTQGATLPFLDFSGAAIGAGVVFLAGGAATGIATKVLHNKVEELEAELEKQEMIVDIIMQEL